MANKIKIARGEFSKMPTLERGEIAYVTDTNQLYIGVEETPLDVDDNVLVNDYEALAGTGLIWEETEGFAGQFQGDFADETEGKDSTNLVKVMNPQRTDEAIVARLDARLQTEAYATTQSLTDAINLLPGTGLTLTSGVLSVNEPFNPSGTFASLRAQATTKEDVDLANVTNDAQVKKISSSTDENVPIWNGTTGDLLSDGYGVETTLTGSSTSLATAQAVKTYADNLAQGIKARTQAFVLVDSNLSGTYDDVPELHEFTADANGAFPTTDGVDTSILNVISARIVLAGQTNAEENGLYVLKEIGDASNPWVLRRCTQCDTSEKIPGSYVFITKGTTYENTGWLFDVDNPITFVLGTDDINVIQFSGAGTFTDGNGITLTGSSFAIDTTVTMDLPSAQTVAGVKTFSETIVGSVNGSAASLIETNTGTQAITIWTGSENDYDTLVSNNEINQNTLYFILEV